MDDQPMHIKTNVKICFGKLKYIKTYDNFVSLLVM